MAVKMDFCLAAALAGERPLTLPSGIGELESREVGVLSVPTGRLVACDPLTLNWPVAFERRSPAGQFPVRLLIVHYEGGDQRIAATIPGFATGIPDRWEMAVVPGLDIASLGPDHYFGYGVDSGTGAFMDVAAAEMLEARMSRDNSYVEDIMQEMDKTYVHTRSWELIGLDEVGRHNAACFSSGMGDGLYASYWGWSGDSLLCLVTDFALLNDGQRPEGVA